MCKVKKKNVAVGVQALRSNLYVKEDNENCGDDASLLGMCGCGCGFGSGIVTGQRDSVQIPEWLENVWKMEEYVRVRAKGIRMRDLLY